MAQITTMRVWLIATDSLRNAERPLLAQSGRWAASGERGFAGEQLREITRVIDAEKSDLFDVLDYIAYARTPLTRAERADAYKPQIMPLYDPKLRTFLDFVLAQYVSQGVGELDQDKLSHLLELKYQTINDAAKQLGNIPAIRDAFVGFQSYLYLDDN